MITTLTLNPAIDRTLIVDNFTANAVNRAKRAYASAGGKGVNASRVVRFLGEDTVALGFLGGTAGTELAAMLDAEGIRHDFVRISGETRTNIKLVDIAGGTCTDINCAGPNIGEESLSELKKTIREYSIKSKMIIFAGGAQSGIPHTFYKDMILELKGTGVKIILDTSGDLLKEGVRAAPWLIKPNAAELSEMLGVRFKGIGEIIKACKELNGTGIECVCVSMGAGGLLIVNGERTVIAVPPKLAAKNTVGAGDFAVGSLAVSLLGDEPLEEAARKACAISAASVTLDGTGVPSEKLIKEIYEQIKCVPLT